MKASDPKNHGADSVQSSVRHRQRGGTDPRATSNRGSQATARSPWSIGSLARSPGRSRVLDHLVYPPLEMAALLLDVGPGDEVIMPSFTFVSTANAFVLRGARPIFVDIRSDTLNIDERLVEAS